MNRRIILPVLIILAAVVVAVVFFRATRSLQRPQPVTSAVAPSPISLTQPPSQYQIDVGSASKEEVAAEVRRRDSQDSKWEWKVPINFYGKAVDENGKPVLGADVRFQWTDLSTTGTQERQVETDAHGSFSLNDVKGKRLVVRVTKVGYYAADSRNQSSFEYANPFEEVFHQPKINAPVLFHLRKQHLVADVISKSTEVVVPGDGTISGVEIESGKINPIGELRIQVWKPWPPRPMTPPYQWKVILTIPRGGLIETSEDFAFQAPETGYEERYVIDMNPALGSEWKVAAERSLYFAFGEPKKYGRLTVRTDGGSRYVFLDYVINQAGRRDLEPGNAAQ